MTTPQQPFANFRTDPAVKFLGLPTLVRSTGESTGGAFGLVEHWAMPPGFASPYHTHHNEDEAFYVVEGEVAFVCDGNWTLAGPGAFVFGPREIPHGFRTVGDSPASMLIQCTPAGFERFVLELSQPFDTPPAPPDMAKLMAVAAKFNIDIHGPLPELPATFTSGCADRQAIDRIRAKHIAALNARDASAWAAVFAQDAVQMPPNSRANHGRAAILAWSEALLRAFQVKFSLDVAELQLGAGHAIESGAYTISLTAEGSAQTLNDSGKYITVYRQDESGGWAIARDIWNSDHPQPGVQ